MRDYIQEAITRNADKIAMSFAKVLEAEINKVAMAAATSAGGDTANKATSAMPVPSMQQLIELWQRMEGQGFAAFETDETGAPIVICNPQDLERLVGILNVHSSLFGPDRFHYMVSIHKSPYVRQRDDGTTEIFRVEPGTFGLLKTRANA